MKKTDRKIAELVEALRGKNSSQTLLIGKVAGTNPFALKLYDLTVTKHIYVNQSFVKTSNAEIEGSIIWDSSQDYVPSSMLNFTKKMFRDDLLSVGDTVIVLQDGISFYILERVLKVA